MAEQLGGARLPFAGTFHAFAHLQVRRHHQALGYPRAPSVISAEAQAARLGAALRAAGVSEASLDGTRLARLLGLGVATEQPLAELLAARAPGLLGRRAAIESALDRYAAGKLADAVVDFDDLMLALAALLESPETGDAIRAGVDHVLVDELQDTSRVQARIALLLGRDADVTVVGDDAQSIYGFRGAHFENVAAFALEDPEIVVLDDAFRSTPEILRVAEALIEGAPGVLPKRLRSRVPSGPPVLALECADAEAEAAAVAERIERLVRGGVRPSELAVLYRSHRQRGAVERALALRGLPTRPLEDEAELEDAPLELPLDRPIEGVALGTIHRAKGLEWDGVFVIGLADGILPSRASFRDRAGSEEERRLAYVAVTRARRHLCLSAPGPGPVSPLLLGLLQRPGLLERRTPAEG